MKYLLKYLVYSGKTPLFPIQVLYSTVYVPSIISKRTKDYLSALIRLLHST